MRVKGAKPRLKAEGREKAESEKARKWKRDTGNF
jgi:hypothetical protein